MNTEYVEKLETAKIALKKLIQASEPGHAYIEPWTDAYTVIKQALEFQRAPKPEETERERRERIALDAACWSWWKRNSPAERQRHVLDALADRHMMIAEVAEKIEGADPGNRRVTYARVAPTIKKMFETGELHREEITGKNNQPAFRYFRAPMSPEVKDLERRLGG